MKTELKGRTLWYDGISEVHPSNIMDLFLMGISVEYLAVTEINQDVKFFNQMSEIKLGLKQEVKLNEPEWILPKKYLEEQYVFDRLTSEFMTHIDQFEIKDRSERIDRYLYELELFDKKGILSVLRVLYYVLDQFRAKKIVYGVGRGSSCSSYLLYIMGIHKVDPVKYEIDIHDFIRD